MDSPAKIINIVTGEVLVACPDPLCNHSASSDTCFYNYKTDRTKVYAAQYVDGHVFFIAEKKNDDGTRMKLYDYDIAKATIEEIYTFRYIETSAQLYGHGHMLFFSAIIGEGSAAEDTAAIGLFAYDVKKKTVTQLDSNARYAIHPTDVAFYDDYYICVAGYNEEKERIRYSKRSYDGVNEEVFETLPDGTTCELFGYMLKPNGLFANTDEHGGIYLWDENRRLSYPVDSATTKPAVYKDSVYFTTRSSGFVELGWNPVTRSKSKGYAYDNEVYVLNKDGSYKHYTIDSEYHFIIEAAYENILIGRIEYRIKGNGDYIGDNSYDYIRINLETGETTLYDTSRRSGFAVKTFVTDVKLNDN